jgi:hypothetical protein
VNAYPNVTCGASDSLPNLSSLSDAIEDGGNFTLTNHGPYYHLYPSIAGGRDYSRKSFYTQNFTVALTSTLYARIGKNFLLGDATITLFRYDTNGGATYYGSYDRNSVYLIAPLMPGAYGFAIYTGYVQSSLQVSDLSGVSYKSFIVI